MPSQVGSPGREQAGRNKLSGRGWGFQQRGGGRGARAGLGREAWAKRRWGWAGWDHGRVGSSWYHLVRRTAPRTEMSMRRLRQQDLRGGRKRRGGGQEGEKGGPLDKVRHMGAPKASSGVRSPGLGERAGSDPSSRPYSRWSRLGGRGGEGEGRGGAGGRGRASVHGISAGWRETGVWSQPGRPFPQPPSKALPWRWPGLGPGTPGPRPLSCCSCSGALPSPSRSVSWGPSLGGPRAAPQAVGCPCGCRARLQAAGRCASGGHWSLRGRGGLCGGTATGRGPGNGWAVCLGGVLGWAVLACEARVWGLSCELCAGYGLWAVGTSKL